MENWYAQYLIMKIRHKEFEDQYANPHLLRARALMEKKPVKQKRISRMGRRIMAALGRYLETLGQVLQKKFQTC